jgi:hypothetical protein
MPFHADPSQLRPREPDPEVVERERRAAYVRALHAERGAVERKVDMLGRYDDDDRPPMPFVDRHDWPEAKERRDQLAAQLDAIDAEIARHSTVLAPGPG